MGGVFVLTGSWELVQNLLSMTCLATKRVLRCLFLDVLVDGLVCAGAWRLLHRVYELLPIREVRAVFTHVCLGDRVRTRARCRWHILLFLGTLL